MATPRSQPRPMGRIPVVLATAALGELVPAWRTIALTLTELGVAAFFISGIVVAATGASGPWFVLVAVGAGIVLRATDSRAGRCSCLAACPAASTRPSAAVRPRRLLRPCWSSACSSLRWSRASRATTSCRSSWRSSDCRGWPSTWPPATSPPRPPPASSACSGFGRGSGSASAPACSSGGSGFRWLRWSSPRSGASSPPWRLDTACRRPPPGTGHCRSAWPRCRSPSRWALRPSSGLRSRCRPMASGDSIARRAAELPQPRLPGLMRTARLAAIFGLLVTAGAAFAIVALVPPEALAIWDEVPLIGLLQFVPGAVGLRVLLTMVVALAGVAMLGHAADASLDDATMTLQRLSRVGAVPESLRALHPRFGTRSRLTDVVCLTSILFLLASGGHVAWLARAYAVGLVWTYVAKLIMLRRMRTRERTPALAMAPELAPGPVASALQVAVVGFSVVLIGALLVLGDPATWAGTSVLLAAAATLAVLDRRPVESDEPTDSEAFQLLSSELSLGQAEARPGGVLVPVRHLVLAVACQPGADGGRRSRRRRHDRPRAGRGRRRRHDHRSATDAGRAAAALAGRRAGRAPGPRGAAADRPRARRLRRDRDRDAPPAIVGSPRRRVGHAARPTTRPACSARPGSAPRLDQALDVRLVIHHRSGRADVFLSRRAHAGAFIRAIST